MAPSIPTSVLSEALERAIAGRRVKAAVFTTFNFEPGFFEEEILPLLFDFTFSHVPALKLIQLEDELRSIDHLAVYYDRRALLTGGVSASLDYSRIPIERTGCFHPKVALILLENEDEEWEPWKSLLVGVDGCRRPRSQGGSIDRDVGCFQIDIDALSIGIWGSVFFPFCERDSLHWRPPHGRERTGTRSVEIHHRGIHTTRNRNPVCRAVSGRN